MTDLYLYNSLTRQKEKFVPYDKNRVTLYACGPTVYNYIHVGNARMISVFDTVFRLLRHIYGADNVVYARNITDVDDKIIQAAKDENVSIDTITQKYTKGLLEDITAINTLEPTFQPLATAYIPHMIAMIKKLIEQNHAYEAENHVLFHVPSYADYGRLSGRNRDEQIAGARVEVAPYKKDPADFVLWKPSVGDQPGWDSPWGFGRPGWHIECSAMSTELLGNTFDIHGGGLDLTFPHHENEIAQSCCADHTSGFARVWMHNGFLQTNNEKMSKSLGNFNFLRDVLQKYDGEVVRYVLMSAQYRQPLEFNFDLLDEAKKVLDRFYRAIEKNDVEPSQPTEAFMAALCDDLNTPMAFAELHRLVGEINKSEGSTHSLVAQLKACAQLIGLLYMKPTAWFQGSNNASDNDAIQSLIDQRIVARHAKDFAKADALRAELTALGIILDDNAEGTTWRRG
jgi:cysteinyl-tRNA synthetase